MARLSICISFYNCIKFLPSFIDQLLNQTCQDFECILVDDGSTDNGASVLKPLIENKKQFKLITHTENVGLGAGRVTGILNSSSEYITFMDCDDEISNTAVETILDNIKKSPDTELFIYNFSMKDQKGKVTQIKDFHETYADYFYSNSPLLNHVWHKVYKKELFHRMSLDFYRTISFAEDLFLSVNCFLHTDKVSFINDFYYTYRFNSLSMVHNRNGRSIYENIQVDAELLRNTKLKEKEPVYQYIKKDSFNCFGMLIYPNLNNEFQRSAPHFRDWIELDNEFHMEAPKGTSFFCKRYIGQIRRQHFAAALSMWRILKLKRIIKRILLGK